MTGLVFAAILVSVPISGPAVDPTLGPVISVPVAPPPIPSGAIPDSTGACKPIAAKKSWLKSVFSK